MRRNLRILAHKPLYWYDKIIRTPVKLLANRGKKGRKLEIGSGNTPLHGFETLDIAFRWQIDYLLDASKPLPFADNTFEVVYASHVLEHIPWYQTRSILQEWVRILAPKGQLEIWVPDGVKICQAFIDAEKGNNYLEQDGWFRFNPGKDACMWASGRIFAYGDGKGKVYHPNWHRALFSARYLIKLFQEVGLVEVREMDHSEVRGYDHEWVNLGIRGRKP